MPYSYISPITPELPWDSSRYPCSMPGSIHSMHPADGFICKEEDLKHFDSHHAYHTFVNMLSRSRSSQESSLVGAFRPVPSCKPQHSSRHTICTSIPSRQSRQPRTQGCTSVYPWDSSSWSDWLQSCNEHSDPSVGNRTTNRMQCSHSGHQKCCHTDQGSSQNQTAHRCNSGSEFIRHNGMMPGQSTWETGKGRSPFVTGCPFDALPDMPIMAPIRQSRSVESLLELQVWCNSPTAHDLFLAMS